MYNTHHGFLIHARDYRETSSILKIFTSEGGIESLIFKGKHTDKDRFKFSIFNEYSFTFDEKYSLPYLTKFELLNQYIFNKKYYLLGLYVNELLYKTLKDGYDFDKVYLHYKEFLINLSDTKDSLGRLALLFEKNLLQDLGYEISLSENETIISDKYYYYDYNEGFKLDLSVETKSSILGSDLESFFINTLTCEKTISNMRSIIRKIFIQVYPDINLLGDKLF
jgi:DNA repair protein RecO (recombination protein O)